jgi:hypothetical protein
MRPLDEPPIDMSKKTTGLSAMLLALMSVCVGVCDAGNFKVKVFKVSSVCKYLEDL